MRPPNLGFPDTISWRYIKCTSCPDPNVALSGLRSPCPARSGTLSRCLRSSTSDTCRASKSAGRLSPPDAVYIGRAIRWYRMPKSKWANPFTVKQEADRERAIGHARLQTDYVG